MVFWNGLLQSKSQAVPAMSPFPQTPSNDAGSAVSSIRSQAVSLWPLREQTHFSVGKGRDEGMEIYDIWILISEFKF